MHRWRALGHPERPSLCESFSLPLARLCPSGLGVLGVTAALSFRDTMDSAKQSAALCLLRLYRTSPHLVPAGDWASRVVHLLNDQHLVSALDKAPPSPEQPSWE